MNWSFNRSINRFFLVLCVIFMTGCSSYRTVALQAPEFLLNPSSKSENLSVAAKAFTEEDCKKYLVRRSLYRGYRPVQLISQNNTDTTYDFSLSRIDLPYCTPIEVAKNVQASAGVNVLGFGSAGFVLTAPLGLAISLTTMSFVPLAIPFIPAVISAGIAKLKVSHANEALDQDDFCKGAKDQILEPHANMNALLFVPKEGYTKNFSVTLIDLETKKPVILNVSAS